MTLEEKARAALAKPKGGPVELKPVQRPLVQVRIKGLQKSGQIDEIQAALLKQGTNDGIAQVAEHVQAKLAKIGRSLSLDRDIYRELEGGIFRDYADLDDAIRNGVVINIDGQEQASETAYDRLMVVAMDAMIEHFPVTGEAQRHIAFLGDEIGYLERVTADSRDELEKKIRAMLKKGQLVVGLPMAFEGGNGRWEKTPFTSQRRDARRILTALRKRNEESRKVKSAERKDDLNELYVGAATIPDAIAAAKGEATGFAEDQQAVGRGGKLVYVDGNNKRFYVGVDEKAPQGTRQLIYGGGHIRIKVEGQKITSTGSAVGRCAGTWRRIHDEGVFITVDQLKNKTIDASNLPSEKQGLAKSLHGLVRSAFLLAKEKAAAEAEDKTLKALATVKADEWDLGTAGKAFVYVEDWDITGRDGTKRTYRTIPFVVETGEGEKKQIRVVACRKAHEWMFAAYREFMDAGQKFDGQALNPEGEPFRLGAALRTVHFHLERGRRRSQNAQADQRFAQQMGAAPASETPAEAPPAES